MAPLASSGDVQQIRELASVVSDYINEAIAVENRESR